MPLRGPWLFSCVVLPGPRASELMPSAQNACETRPRGIWQTAWGGGGSPLRQLAGAGVKVASKLADSSPVSGTALPRSFLLWGCLSPRIGPWGWEQEEVWPPGFGRSRGRRWPACTHNSSWVWRKLPDSAVTPWRHSAERHPRAGAVTTEEPAEPARRCPETRCSTD